MLTNILPARYRKALYAAYTLAVVVTGALAIAEVDVGKAPDVLAYLGGALGLVAASNVYPTTGTTVQVTADPSVSPTVEVHADPVERDERGWLNLGTAALLVLVLVCVALFFAAWRG